MEARALIAEARAQYWPTITANPAWSRSRSSGNLQHSSTANTGQTSTLWAAPLDVSWTPDFWGKIGTRLEKRNMRPQASEADLELEKLTEQASLAQYYFEIRGQDMLQKILNDTVAADQKALDVSPGRIRCRNGRLHICGRGASHTAVCAGFRRQCWVVAGAV